MLSLLRSLLAIAYLVVGIVVANSHEYFAHIHSVTTGVSAALAVVLWPAVLLGANLHLR